MSWLTGSAKLFAIAGDAWASACTPDGPGVYRLVAVDVVDGNMTPTVLARLCGTDQTGTLYIGRTEDMSSMAARSASLQGRLGTLIRGIRNDREPRHPAAHAIKTAPKLMQCFPPEKLAVTWEFTAEPTEREKALLEQYRQCFGELPPLNAQR